MTTPTTSVIIAEDEMVTRDCWSHLLGGEADVCVVGVAKDGSEVLELAAQLDPDVVLMGLRMPDRLDGIRAIEALRRRRPNRPAVVAFTDCPGTDLAIASIRAGAVGFVSKSDPPSCVAKAIRAVAQGGAMVSPKTLIRLLDRLGGCNVTSLSECTAREIAVLRLVCQGMSNDEIAGQLFICNATVRTHVDHLREKLGAHSRVDLVILGLGWVPRHPSDPV